MQKKKILLVDDEKTFTDIVKMNLEALGKYEVAIENSAKGAIAAARRFMPNVILLDIMMPEMDGFKVLEKLKTDPETMSIPVLMLTAIAKEEARSKAASLYNEDYIEKPVRRDVLVERIERILDRYGG